MEQNRGVNMEELAMIDFEQELNLMELSEIEQRIENGPLTSWETEHWDELEEMLFLKRREMVAE